MIDAGDIAAVRIFDGHVNWASVGHDGTVQGDGKLYLRVARYLPCAGRSVAEADENDGLINIDRPARAVVRISACGDGPWMTAAGNTVHADRFSDDARRAVTDRAPARDEPRREQERAPRHQSGSRVHVSIIVPTPKSPKRNSSSRIPGPSCHAHDREMLPSIDDTSWPIVTINYGEEITFDEIVELSQALERIFHRRGPLVMLVDIGALRAIAVTALHRKRLAEESDRLAAMGAFVAEAVIVPNPVLRAVYVGYTWAGKRKSYPSQPFRDSASALVWARQQVRAAASAKVR